MPSRTLNRPVELLTPVTGTVIDIGDVPDPVFSGKLVGEGFGVSGPTGGPVVAPVGGRVTLVAETRHAIGFKTDSGIEVLVHLGIDTVELEGSPFVLDVVKGDAVEAGQQIGTMDARAVVAAGKDPTVIVVVTNSAKKLEAIDVQKGTVDAGEPVAALTLKKPAGADAAAGAAGSPAAAATAETAAEKDSAPEAAAPDETGSERPGDLSGYDALAWDILDNIGGRGNVRSVTHCITRVRFYLDDDGKARDEVVSELDGVIDVVRAGGQYQVVIGPAVEDVYDAIVKQLGTDEAAPNEDAAAQKRERPKTAWGWFKHGFSSLIGVITGSLIPIVGLLAAAGILNGILTLLVQFHWVDKTSSTYVIINAIANAVFFFLPIFVGFTAARRLGADPIIVAIVGGVLTHPTLLALATGEPGTPGLAPGSFLGMQTNAEFFGLPINVANYSGQIFPIIVAAWVASILEPWLKRVIPPVLRMIFVPLIEVVVVSLAILLVLGPLVMFVSTGIATGLQWLYEQSPSVSGLLIGGFYQCLVIFGLHWAVIPIVSQQISGEGHSYLNAIISATMVAQGGAVLAVFLKSKVLRMRELAGPAAISAFCGVTEPAMYGVNLKYGRVFVMGSIGGAVGGFLTGLFNVDMWGFTGSLIGFFSFLNPEGIDGSFAGFWIASVVALVVAFVLTWLFGYKDADAEAGHEVKKVRLGNREPVQR